MVELVRKLLQTEHNLEKQMELLLNIALVSMVVSVLTHSFLHLS